MDPEVQNEITKELEEHGAKTAAPTISGGDVGANMMGGGSLGQPEMTDDKQGNPGGAGPEILEVPDKPRETA